MPAVDETTLLGLVTMLVANTGRYDLVGTKASGGDLVPDYTVNAGAYGYVNKAVRWWDRNARHVRKVRQKSVELLAGGSQITVPGLMSVQSMRLESGSTPLVQADESWLHSNVGADLSAVATSETAAYWAPAVKDSGDSGADPTYWILPPMATDTDVVVTGYFYTPAMTTGTDKNWWTLNWSEAVLYVAMQLVNDMDLNPFTNSTLKRLVDDVHRSVWTDDIMEEIAFYGDTMAG